MHYLLYWECEEAQHNRGKHNRRIIHADEGFFDKVLRALTGGRRK